jgi:hypothetical protein
MDESPRSRRRRERHPSPCHRRWLCYLGIVAALPVLAAACGGSSAAPSTTTSGTVPAGWKTLTYGKVTISVPKSWTVFRGAACPNATAKNALYLGAPDGACPYEVGQATPTNFVTVSLVSGPPPNTIDEGCPSRSTVNGLVVDVARSCTSSSSAGTTQPGSTEPMP